MNSSAPVQHPHTNHNLKPFMGVAAFRRALEQAIAQGAQGAVDYALEHLYLGQDQIFSLIHAPQVSSEVQGERTQNVRG